MTVQLIDTSGILDLTGGKPNAKESIEAPEVLETESLEPSEPIESPEHTTEVEGTEALDTSNKQEQPSSQEVEEDSEPEYFFGESQVTVQVPEEVHNALQEAGIPEKELLAALFSKGSDFTLPADMQEKLEQKFGKTIVAGYLSMYKNMNSTAIKDAALAKEEADKTVAQEHSEFMELVGDIKGLEAIEDFVLANFNDKQIAAYNALMESDNHSAHILIIEQIKNQMQAIDASTESKKFKPIGDDSGSPSDTNAFSKGYLTKQEYEEIMDSDKYWQDMTYMNRVDAARYAGMRLGK